MIGGILSGVKVHSSYMHFATCDPDKINNDGKRSEQAFMFCGNPFSEWKFVRIATNITL